MASKNELLDYLDKHVFLRILHASERDRGAKELEDLKELKVRIHDEMGRFHGFDSAEKIVEVYRQETEAEVARPVNARLKDLGLPTLADVRQEFLTLAGEAS